ncbi:hypothetical protein pb186bvf_016245 [Paramecium bursaria]
MIQEDIQSNDLGLNQNCMEQIIRNCSNNNYIRDRPEMIFNQFEQYEIEHYFEALNLSSINNLYKRQKLFARLTKSKIRYDQEKKEQQKIEYDFEGPEQLQRYIQLITHIIQRIKQDMMNYRIYKLEIIKSLSIGTYLFQLKESETQKLIIEYQKKSISIIEQNFEKVSQLLSKQLIDEIQFVISQLELLFEAQGLYDFKEYGQALQLSLNIQQPNYDVLFLKAKCYQKLNMHLQSIQIYDQLLVMTNNDQKFLYLKGKSLIKLKDQAQAQTILFELINIDNKYYKAYEQLGQMIHYKKEQYFNRNKNLIRQSNSLTKVLKQQTFLLKGLALQNMKQYDQAIQMYQKALSINPNEAGTYTYIGVILEYSGKFREAIMMFDRAIQINPNFANAYYSKGKNISIHFTGVSLNYLGNQNDAIMMFEHALQIDPNHAQAAYNIGVHLLGNGKFNEANVMFDRALQVNPDYVEAYNNKGSSLRNLEKFEEALQMYDMALKINPNDATIIFNKGITLNDLGKFEEAILMYDIVIKIIPNFVMSYLNKGISLDNLGAFNDAILMLDSALKINPNYAEAYFHKGSVLDNLEKYNQAIMMYDRAIQINPYYADAYINRGVSLESLQNFTEAILMYDRAIQINPNSADAYYNKGQKLENILGVSLEKLGRFSEAIKAQDCVIQLDPHFAKAYTNKGRFKYMSQGYALGKLGKLNEAIVMFDMAITINPNDAKSYICKGDTLTQMKRYPEAQQMYQVADQLDYENQSKIIFSYLIGDNSNNLEDVSDSDE